MKRKKNLDCSFTTVHQTSVFAHNKVLKKCHILTVLIMKLQNEKYRAR